MNEVSDAAFPRRFHRAGLLALGTFLFALNLGGYDLWPPDEPRFAEVAREMALSGDYLSPRVNGESYLEKPPLLFWMTAAVSAPFGRVTEWSARIPSVAAALITLACTYVIALRLFGARVALWSALVLMTNVRFWWQARTGQIDMLLTACTTLALLSLCIWNETRRGRWLFVFYAAQATAVYAKGPVGIVIPLLTLLVFYWREKDARRRSHWVLGTLAAAALVLLWFIPARMAAADAAGQAAHSEIASNLFRQTIGRFFLGVSKAQWPWYYLGTIPVDLVPWTLFLPWTLVWVWRNRKEGTGMRFLLSWAIPALIFFSVCVGKRAIYLLPLFPAFAILVARSVLELADGAHAVWRRRAAAVWALALLVLGLGTITLPLTPLREYSSNGLTAFGLVALALAGDLAVRAARGDMRTLHAVLAGHFALLAAAGALLVLPHVNQYKSAKDFCAPLRALSEKGTAYKLYSVGFSREEYIFYAEHFHEAVFSKDLPLPAGLPMDDETWSKTQKLLRAGLAAATAEVPIASFDAIKESDVRSLRDAVALATRNAGADPALLAAFLDTLRAEIAKFSVRFDSEEPAFMFIREDDWRAFLPLYPSAPPYKVIAHSQIGRRSVLLLANPASARL